MINLYGFCGLCKERLASRACFCLSYFQFYCVKWFTVTHLNVFTVSLCNVAREM